LSKPKECLFCGSSAPLTEEHVFPKWLRQLGYTGHGWREILDERATPVNRVEKGSPFNKTVKVVCGPCNNEWMASMEDGVKPILLRMFNLTDQIALDGSAQLLLSRWAFKTMCVIAELGTDASPIPLAHPREFRATDRPPAQCQLWIGTATGQPHPQGVELVQSRILPREAHVTRAGVKVDVPIYQARFRLLNVFFDSFGYESPNMKLEQSMDGELGRALLIIWPPKHPKIWWPPAQTLDAVGGVDGLGKIPLKGLPSFLPTPPSP
jgi:hypothetical protein